MDKDGLMSKSEDGFTLWVQTWEFCGGFLLVRETQGENFNCGIEVFEGSKNLAQLSYRMTETYQERRIQGTQYTN